MHIKHRMCLITVGWDGMAQDVHYRPGCAHQLTGQMDQGSTGCTLQTQDVSGNGWTGSTGCALQTQNVPGNRWTDSTGCALQTQNVSGNNWTGQGEGLC